MKNSLPSITIVTPSFNQGKYIEKTIISVLSQKYPNLEYIVMDGGSTDKTIEILKKYESRLKWFSQKDDGQADALNKAFAMAKGEIVGYLCADDVYATNTLEIVGKVFAKNPEIKIITGDYQIIDSSGQIIRSPERYYKKLLWYLNCHNTFLFANYVNEPSTFWRRSLFSLYGVFDVNLDYVFDYEWWLRVSKDHRIVIINKVLSYFRIHNESKSGSRYRQAFINDYLAAARHTNNKILLGLKKMHNLLIVKLYSILRY